MALTDGRLRPPTTASFLSHPANAISALITMPSAGPPVRATVIQLRGEHDCSNEGELTAMLTRAITLDDADLVVDLRQVTFMDASTLRALVGICVELGQRGRTLTLRSPSRLARRILDICGLSDLVEA